MESIDPDNKWITNREEEYLIALQQGVRSTKKYNNHHSKGIQMRVRMKAYCQTKLMPLTVHEKDKLMRCIALQTVLCNGHKESG